MVAAPSNIMCLMSLPHSSRTRPERARPCGTSENHTGPIQNVGHVDLDPDVGGAGRSPRAPRPRRGTGGRRPGRPRRAATAGTAIAGCARSRPRAPGRRGPAASGSSSVASWAASAWLSARASRSRRNAAGSGGGLALGRVGHRRADAGHPVPALAGAEHLGDQVGPIAEEPQHGPGEHRVAEEAVDDVRRDEPGRRVAAAGDLGARQRGHRRDAQLGGDTPRPKSTQPGRAKRIHAAGLGIEIGVVTNTPVVAAG